MSIYRDRQDFWSRRRAAVLREEHDARTREEAVAHEAEQAVLEAKPDAEILAELDLPDPDSLKPGDDFSAFMDRAVPDRIRRRALRVLWRANPLLANLDELLEYGEDYTDSAVVVENLQTAYQVGKGMLRHVEEMARQADDQADDDADDQDGGIVEVASDEPETGMQEPDEELLSDAQANLPDQAGFFNVELPEAEETFAAMPTPRRMTFRTEEPA